MMTFGQVENGENIARLPAMYKKRWQQNVIPLAMCKFWNKFKTTGEVLCVDYAKEDVIKKVLIDQNVWKVYKLPRSRDWYDFL